MSTHTRKNCETCLWSDQCGDGSPCEDYSPLDSTEVATTYYEAILAENIEEYSSIIAEYGHDLEGA